MFSIFSRLICTHPPQGFYIIWCKEMILDLIYAWVLHHCQCLCCFPFYLKPFTSYQIKKTKLLILSIQFPVYKMNFWCMKWLCRLCGHLRLDSIRFFRWLNTVVHQSILTYFLFRIIAHTPGSVVHNKEERKKKSKWQTWIFSMIECLTANHLFVIWE